MGQIAEANTERGRIRVDTIPRMRSCLTALAGRLFDSLVADAVSDVLRAVADPINKRSERPVLGAGRLVILLT